MNRLSDFDFFLPKELIAEFPSEKRGQSRLLIVRNDQNKPSHSTFFKIVDLLNPGDALVVNNTRVSKARLYAKKMSGGKVEILILKPLLNNQFECLIKGLGKNKKDVSILIEEKLPAKVIKENIIEVSGDLLSLMNAFGKIPLPPYIKRPRESLDDERYQTIYAKDFSFGAVAAPTAGLHFTEEILEKLKEKNIKIVETTLHVGLGTFLPVKTDNIEQHKMHKEYFILAKNEANTLNEVKKNNGRIIAVGSTALRVLEQVMQWSYEKGQKEFFPYEGETDIFIKPGYKFLACNAIITNFHLPKSTLFILISAILGREKALNIYEEAIKEKYRFFSYGDACYFDI